MKQSPLLGALLVCSLAGSPVAFAVDLSGMTDDTTCWRDHAGVIVTCSGKGQAENGSGTTRPERLYVTPGERGAVESDSGPWVSKPGRKVWTIPAINKRWGAPSYKPGWSVPPMSKRWGNPRYERP